MTSTEGLLSVFLQRAITFLVTTRLERFLGAPTLGDIQFNSGEIDYLSVRIAMNLAQTLYPRHGPVGSHDAERAVKGIHFCVEELVEELDFLRAVLLMDTAQPGSE